MAVQLRGRDVRSSSRVTADTRGGLAPSRLTAPEWDAKLLESCVTGGDAA